MPEEIERGKRASVSTAEREYIKALEREASLG